MKITAMERHISFLRCPKTRTQDLKPISDAIKKSLPSSNAPLPKVAALKPAKIAQSAVDASNSKLASKIRRSINLRMLFTRAIETPSKVGDSSFVRRKSIIPFSKTEFTIEYRKNGTVKSICEENITEGSKRLNIIYQSDGKKLDQITEFNQSSGKPEFRYDFCQDGITVKSKTQYLEDTKICTYYWKDGKTPFTLEEFGSNGAERKSLKMHDHQGRVTTEETYNNNRVKSFTSYNKGVPMWKDEFDDISGGITSRTIYKTGEKPHVEYFNPHTAEARTEPWVSETPTKA